MVNLGQKINRYSRKFGEKLNSGHSSLGSKVSYQNKYKPVKDGQPFMEHKYSALERRSHH